MSLKTKIDSDIKQAMLAKKQDELRALRAIKSMILLAQTDSGAGENLSEEEEMKILMKAAKQRRDSIDVYKEQGRDDLAKEEQVELDVIQKYLPEMMSEEEVEAKIKEVISENGASGPQDMGKMMPLAIKALAGKADNKMISSILKKLLTS
ncbi:MAG: GatB/YqeY domain-containing protein [Cytophagales bacterium]